MTTTFAAATSAGRAGTAELSVPLVLYDDPGTTHFTVSLDLYSHLAGLPHVGALKIPPIAGGVGEVRERVQEIRAVIPEHVRLGISGDGVAATGLLAGCDAWFSSLGGTIPEAMAAIARPALAGDEASAIAASERLRSSCEADTAGRARPDADSTRRFG
ncbi:MAG: dihydrodipicolinate synthase family protein [Brachybacterium sp.]|nr:dihydrodipicolinate synthase family protein [Brachybacterium sp.]MDN6330855.1 dihydrodipicolinate synthase family protein [Brachybacterium sp.]